jgi:hypothetical protein
MKTSHGWIVLKIDFESQQVSKISALVYNNLSGRNSKVIIDQLNKQNLLIRGLGLFATGSLIDDTIVFNPRRQFNEWLTYPKLAGNYLYGFHPLDDETNVPNWEYCTFDLTTSTKEAINVSFILDDGCHIQIWEVSCLFWCLMPTNFSTLFIHGPERDCMVFLVAVIIRYFNYIFDSSL